MSLVGEVVDGVLEIGVEGVLLSSALSHGVCGSNGNQSIGEESVSDLRVSWTVDLRPAETNCDFLFLMATMLDSGK